MVKSVVVIVMGLLGLVIGLEMECPRPEWKQRRSHNTCYWFQDGDRLPQYKADERCRRYDGKLVKIDDMDENVWIIGNVIPDEISGQVGGSSRDFYIGLRREGDDQWRWEVDNTLMDWSGYWQAGEPNNYRNKENCVVMHEGTGEWNDVMCGDDFHFICEYQIPTPLRRGPTPSAINLLSTKY